MSKRLIFLFLTIWLVFLLPINAYAHPGKTDGSGGHYNHSTGEYHYHHGYPAHQHTNGKCPYNHDDKTDHSPSGGSSSSSSKIEDSEDGILKGLDFGTAAFCTVLFTVLLSILFFKINLSSIFTKDGCLAPLLNILIANILSVLLLIFIRNVIV